MKRTDAFDDDIMAYLQALGIKYTPLETMPIQLVVDRTSMVRRWPGLDENGAYEYTLELIRDLLRGSDMYVSWGTRTDEYLGVEVYQPESLKGLP